MTALPVSRGTGLSLCSTLRLISAPASAALRDEHPGWTQSGNVLQFALPLAALGLSFWLPADPSSVSLDALDTGSMSPGLNWPGPRLDRSAPADVAIALARTEVITYALKYSVDARRPNGGSHGFPSGHTSAAFMGAEYIRKEFGWGRGVPALATASWVGYTRVESHNHYWRDVLAGALIGVASNHDFDSVDTPMGALSIAPTLLSSDPDDLSSPIVPGLLFDLRF